MSDLLAQTRAICQLLEIKPARSKGQNFLINEKIYDDLIKAADLQADDIVLEVGPGLGFLTAKLARRARQVIAVELDDKLANYLEMAIGAQAVQNLTVINEDILKFNWSAYWETFLKEHDLSVGTGYKIITNLPYNITSIFLRQFLSGEYQPRSLVLMLQKEVAQRIAAAPPDMSILAISVQYYAVAQVIREVKAGNFWPSPEVDSSIIKLEVKPRILATAEDKWFFRLVRVGFSAKRKMLKNNLVAGLKIAPLIIEASLQAQALDPKVRAEQLSLVNWQKLFAALRPYML